MVRVRTKRAGRDVTNVFAAGLRVSSSRDLYESSAGLARRERTPASRSQHHDAGQGDDGRTDRAVHRRSESVWNQSFGQGEADAGPVRALHWARQQSTQKGGDQHG